MGLERLGLFVALSVMSSECWHRLALSERTLVRVALVGSAGDESVLTRDRGRPDPSETVSIAQISSTLTTAQPKKSLEECLSD